MVVRSRHRTRSAGGVLAQRWAFNALILGTVLLVVVARAALLLLPAKDVHISRAIDQARRHATAAGSTAHVADDAAVKHVLRRFRWA